VAHDRLSSRYLYYKNKIAEYFGKLGYLTPNDREHLERMQEAINEERRVCHHIFEVVTTFTSKRRLCVYCEHEDKA
jgi:hypothetical protein